MTPLNEALYKAGATLIRSRKHNVWRLPDGRIFVTPRSPSDPRSVRNCLAQLKRMLQ